MKIKCFKRKHVYGRCRMLSKFRICAKPYELDVLRHSVELLVSTIEMESFEDFISWSLKMTIFIVCLTVALISFVRKNNDYSNL